jgi:hypothetical protein
MSVKGEIIRSIMRTACKVSSCHYVRGGQWEK